METHTLLIAFGLTLFAGLSTGIGGLIALFTKKTNKKLLSFVLGFSAGVMIYISLAELLTESSHGLIEGYGKSIGALISLSSFFIGIAVIAIINKFIPDYEKLHEVHKVEEVKNRKLANDYGKLYKCGVCTAIALSIHNFPEGIATFTSSLVNARLGVAIALAVALHNIPEGISVAIPFFYSTNSRRKAVLYSFLSGMTEPLGALIAFLVLAPFLNPVLLSLMFAFVAGIMVYISFDELLPAAREYGEEHMSIYGIMAGIAVMAFSLVLLV
ncbi:zinc transporter ZupT [Candidatus Woesearchaeota archaeon]|nr:zinc transporter ZupT [Candidatus Woesearchaeota archaeon]